MECRQNPYRVSEYLYNLNKKKLSPATIHPFETLSPASPTVPHDRQCHASTCPPAPEHGYLVLVGRSCPLPCSTECVWYDSTGYIFALSTATSLYSIRPKRQEKNNLQDNYQLVAHVKGIPCYGMACELRGQR